MKQLDTDSLGFRVRAARSGINMNQRKFAEALGIQPNYLGKIERGVCVPSEALLMQIAKEAHVSYVWLSGENIQSSYPMPDEFQNQTKGHSATSGHLASILRDSCKPIWGATERKRSDFPKSDWVPDYVLSLPEDAKIKWWCFDFSLCIYNQPDWINPSGTPNPKWAFNNFLANIVFGNPLICKTTKYSFLVPDADTYNTLLRRVPLPSNNLSIIQIDLESQKIRREDYLCTCADKGIQNYLLDELTF